MHRATSSAVPFIGAPKVWRQLGAEGKGTKVAVIDTGVDYLHADFGGPGTEEAYENNDPLHIERGTFPTNKVIGGYDFVGEDYEPDPLEGDPSNDVPRPDPDPLDIQGHGSHVSGICCGVGVGNRIGKGVAPKAKILALKVFALGSTTGDVIAAAMERAIDPNGDGSFADAVDVINMSLGSDYGTILSPDIVATERAIAIGVTVVAASGNAGNQPAGGVAYITGAPGVSEGSISVAASIDEFRALKLSPTAPSNVTLPNEGLSAHQDWSAPPSAALTGDVVDVRVAQTTTFGATPVPEDRYLCDSTPSGRPFEGKIALVYKGSTDAGDCDGTEKVFHAQEAGAVAVILWSGFGDIPFALGPGLFVDDITVPAVMVSTSDGQALADADSPGAPDSYDTGGLTVSLPAEEGLFPAFVDRIADFSSEGPAGLTDILKPDISAPGFNITSASVGTGNGDLTISGTSMSTPMVAGVAAILKELHPNFPPIKIKALIMNQATRSVRDSFGIAPVSATVMGAGRIRGIRQRVDQDGGVAAEHLVRRLLRDRLGDPVRILQPSELRHQEADLRGRGQRSLLGLSGEHRERPRRATGRRFRRRAAGEPRRRRQTEDQGSLATGSQPDRCGRARARLGRLPRECRRRRHCAGDRAGRGERRARASHGMWFRCRLLTFPRATRHST